MRAPHRRCFGRAQSTRSVDAPFDAEIVGSDRSVTSQLWSDLLGLRGRLVKVRKESSLRVEIVGEFRLLLDGDEVLVSRPQVRTVLALLASAPSPISVLELEDALWPKSIPDNPVAALRTIISRTRSVLGPLSDHLVLNSDALSLNCQSDWREMFELLPIRDEEQDSALLEAVLDRVDGSPFVGVVDSMLVDGRRSRFEQAREQLCRQHVRLDVAEGNDESAVQRALAILETSPTDESIACLGAQALARLGRKARGIELLQRTRTELAARGLLPSDELLAVEGEILRNASDFAPTPTMHDADRPVNFVGRTDELEELNTLGPGGVLYIDGEAGVGKSSLLGVYADRCLADGIPVAIARASASAAAPMSAVTALVEQLLVLDGVEVAEEHRSALAMLSPEIVSDAPLPASREALILGATGFILDAVETSRVVLAVDDVQWLDIASLLTLHALIESSRCRLVMLARPGNSARVLADLEQRVLRRTLGPLTPDQAAEVVGDAVPGLGRDRTSDLYRRSGGNPLFLNMLLDLLENEIDVDGTLPPVVLAAVQRRMAALSTMSRRVLQMASVLGTTFDERTVSAIEPAAVDGFTEAEAAGLIDRFPETGVSVFRHALVADAAYQLLGEGDRIALHDQIGRLIEAEGAGAILVFPHCQAAVSLDGWRASELAVAAAQQHLDAYDWEGAIRVASWGLGEGNPSDEHRFAIAKARGELALGIANSHLRLVDAARLARTAEDPAALVEAVIEVCSSGSLALTGLDIEVVRELVDDALPLAREEGRLDELHAAAARAFVYSRHGAFGQHLYRESFQSFETCEPRVQELILRNSEAGLSNPNDFALAQRATMLLNQAADRNPELRWLARWFGFRDALIDGDGDRLGWALRDIRNPSNKAERRHTFVVLGKSFDMDMQRSWAEATMALIHGDFDLAEQCAEQALHVGLSQLAIRDDGFGEGWVTASYGLLLLAIRHGQGRLAELVEVVETSAPLVPAWRVAIIIVNHAAGNIERVESELAGITADNFAALVPDPTWTSAMFLLAEPVAEFCDPAVVVELYDLISPFQDRMSYSGLCTFGPMHEACATLANALGKTELESSHRERAREVHRRLQQRSRWAYDELRSSHNR